MSETTVKLSRGDGTPWGFRLGGGKDFGYPLCIQRSNPGSLAEMGGVTTGDQIVRIGGRSTEHMTHQEAQNAILNAGNYLDLTIAKGSSMTWAPSVQAVGNIAPGSQGHLTKTSLAAHKQPHTPIGSGHNTTAKPFSPPVVNKQYNCPAALYSMENIRDALEKQSEVLTGGAKGINFMKDEKPLNTDSAVYRMIQEEEKGPRRPPMTPPVQSTPQSMGSGVDCSPLQPSGLRHVEAPRAPINHSPQQDNVQVGGANVCAECGKLIVGVFCRIKDRNMHAECFRCATCGNYLKNQGYYLVGGKLYCDVHARNASIMLKEPVSSATVQQGQCGSPIPSSPTFGAPSTPPAAMSPKPFGGTTPPTFRSVGPPVPPKPFSQRNSGCFEPSAAPAMGHDFGAAPKWPPQQNQQISSMTTTTTTTTSSFPSSGLNAGAGNRPAPRRGRGMLNQSGGRIPICATCGTQIRGPFISAVGKCWCPAHFLCANGTCRRDLMDSGFVEENNLLYCEHCFESYLAPTCSKCHQRIKGDCLTAIDRPWHPQCFTCTYCHRPFKNNSFYLEDGKPYCENDWNELFTSKCFGCGYPIEAGDRWIEALSNNYHSACFKCTVCHNPLEGQSFYAKSGKPFCRLHAR